MVLGLLLLVLRREMSGSLADAILPGLTDLRSLHNLLDTLKEGSLDHTLNGVNERNFNQLDGWNVDNLLVRLDLGNMENAFSNLWKRHIIGLHGLLVDLSSLSSGIRSEHVLLLQSCCARNLINDLMNGLHIDTGHALVIGLDDVLTPFAVRGHDDVVVIRMTWLDEQCVTGTYILAASREENRVSPVALPAPLMRAVTANAAAIVAIIVWTFRTARAATVEGEAWMIHRILRP